MVRNGNNLVVTGEFIAIISRRPDEKTYRDTASSVWDFGQWGGMVSSQTYDMVNSMSSLITVESIMAAYPYSIEAEAHANSAKTMLTQFK